MSYICGCFQNEKYSNLQSDLMSGKGSLVQNVETAIEKVLNEGKDQLAKYVTKLSFCL